MSSRLLAALLLLAALGSGCRTAVGNYFANRARDFGECFHAEIAAGVGLGGEVRLAGVADVGLGIGVLAWPGAGWSYGAPVLRDGIGGDGFMAMPFFGPGSRQANLVVLRTRERQTRPPGRLHEEHSYALLPALLTFAGGPSDPTWIWETPGGLQANRRSQHRWARLHAFDVEATVFAGIVGVSLGFSLGEFADFLLGWFGADIAGDDSEWKPPPK